MNAKRLTSAGVARIKASGKRIEIADTQVRGLRLVVQPSGRKSWALRYRLAGKTAKFTLGSWPDLDVTDVRSEAVMALKQIAQGAHPLAARRTAEAYTVDSVVADWFKRDQDGNRTVEEVRRAFKKDILPAWGNRPIASITRPDVIAVLDAIADRGARVQTRRVHAYLHRLFRWSVGRGIIAANPVADLPKPGAEIPRDRILSDDELARVWRAASTLAYPFGPAFRLLILTGARRSEIVSLSWDEVDEEAGAIHLNGVRTKNGKPHSIPLSKPALTIVDGLPHIGRASNGYVFTTTGRKPVGTISKAKALLDELAAGIDGAGKTLDEPERIVPWRTHDLRRTVATNLQRLGTRLEVIEAVLGHVGGSRSGIVGVYQRYSFDDEARRALDAWGRRVTELVEGKKPAKVVPIGVA